MDDCLTLIAKAKMADIFFSYHSSRYIISLPHINMKEITTCIILIQQNYPVIFKSRSNCGNPN